MRDIFLPIFNRCIAGSLLVCLALLFRPLLRRAPRFLRLLPWALVTLRLVCPFDFPSIFSLAPRSETVYVEPEMQTILFKSGYNPLNDMVSTAVPDGISNEVSARLTVTQIAAVVWLVGVAAMLGWLVFSNLRLSRRLRTAIRMDGNIYEADGIRTAFARGVFRPRIYLPYDVPADEREMMIAHEQTHIRFRDPLWKIVGWAILSVYWFSPLLWIGYFVFARDLEYACDDRTVEKLGEEKRAAYARTILSAAANEKAPLRNAAAVTAFGHSPIFRRVMRIAKPQKKSLVFTVLAVLICLFMTACFLTTPVEENDSSLTENQIYWANFVEAINPNSLYVADDAHLIPVKDEKTVADFSEMIRTSFPRNLMQAATGDQNQRNDSYVCIFGDGHRRFKLYEEENVLFLQVGHVDIDYQMGSGTTTSYITDASFAFYDCDTDDFSNWINTFLADESA